MHNNYHGGEVTNRYRPPMLDPGRYSQCSFMVFYDTLTLKGNGALSERKCILREKTEDTHQGSQVVQQNGIQCFNYKGFGHYAKECRKPKRVKDYTYHKNKMNDAQIMLKRCSTASTAS
ncbi:retrovirus-related pol polyprotein from transposon TNT 1-94 [Tanacetum coccineum]|uniref:Retrovirus-related pol polyprotein from transposon TNT 1-94 n=1 Tax=Tanacetum coccineum TaxID=301880 RepID=A0ABQ5HM48_9ASTR